MNTIRYVKTIGEASEIQRRLTQRGYDVLVVPHNDLYKIVIFGA